MNDTAFTNGTFIPDILTTDTTPANGTFISNISTSGTVSNGTSFVDHIETTEQLSNTTAFDIISTTATTETISNVTFHTISTAEAVTNGTFFTTFAPETTLNGSYNYNYSDNRSDTYYYGFDETSYSYVLYGMCTFSGLTVVVNLVILAATKFTTAGKSATLVFIRSLCVGDMLIGLFGILKSLMLNSLDGRIINCFLPESVFLSSSTTMCLTLLWVNIDSYLRLVRPLRYANKMDKANVIMAMMVLWNASFIVGFLPLMGWSSDKFVCNLFHFYNPVYISLVSSIWVMCTIASCVMQVLLRNVLSSIQSNSNFIPASSLEFRKYSQLVVIIRNDLILWIICYLPCVFYIIVNFNTPDNNDINKINANLIFFLPVFLLRSFVCAFMHSYKTVRIQKILRHMSNSGGKRQLNKETSNDSSEAISSISDKTCRRHSCCCGKRLHPNPGLGKTTLSGSPSVITVITEEESTQSTEASRNTEKTTQKTTQF